MGTASKPILGATAKKRRQARSRRMKNRISEIRNARKISQDRLAELVGTGRSQIVKLERGERRLTVEWMERIARALQCEPAELLLRKTTTVGLPRKLGTEAYAAMDSQQKSDVDFRLANIPIPSLGARDVPIRGIAAGGIRGGFQLGAETIDYAPRPPALTTTKNIYSIFVLGDSMAPAFESGALVYVSPDRPARAGDYVIVQLRNDADQVTEALFKRLKSQDDAYLTLEQFNPAKTLKIARADVAAVHRVYPWNEVFGL
jgi:phage repressor protein C with HTH and peptisase S24 domain